METIIKALASGQRLFTNLLRVAIFIVMAWIGGLKAFQYEADGIVPFVANSPLMSYFYNDPAEYKGHMNKEGQVVPQNIKYHEQNGTYLFAHALGVVIVVIGLFNLFGIWSPNAGMIGGSLTFLMALVTLSFLVTTPEAYVPALGGEQHGFPYLSGAGRLVIKDVIMLAGGLIITSASARDHLSRKDNL